MGRSCQFHRLLALQPQGVEHRQQIFKNDLYPHCNIQMRRNRLTSFLAYHPFHNIPPEPVDEIFFSSLIQTKDNTAIQYLQYTSDFLTKRWDIVTCSSVFNLDFVVAILIFPSLSNMEVGTGERSKLRTVFIKMSLD